MTTVVVQTAFLGDVLLTIPSLVALRRDQPQRRIVLVTTPQAADFMMGLPFADDVVAFDKRGEHRSASAMRALARSVGQDADTLAIVPHKSLRTTRFVRAMEPRRSVAFRDAAFSWLYDERIEYPATGHYADKVLTLTRHTESQTAWTKEMIGPVALCTDEDRVRAQALVPFQANGAVVLAPGSVWPTKRWPLDRFRAVADQLVQAGERVIVIGDPGIRGGFAEHERIVDLCGQTTLREAAALIAGARAVVANDSAPLHLASLQGIPGVGIFGPTIPEFGFAPFGAGSSVVQVLQPCAPCSIHGTSECPIGTHRCMTDVTPGMVLSVLPQEHS
jgi:heptosyltransferase-2